MSQQLWCWGRDIKSPQGNLLMNYGFERHRESGKGSSGSSCYRLDDGPLHVDQQMSQWYLAVDRLGVLDNEGKQS